VALIAFILVVGLANFALGFVLAVHFGHGPSWTELQKMLPSRSGDNAPADKSHGDKSHADKPAGKPAAAAKAKAH